MLAKKENLLIFLTAAFIPLYAMLYLYNKAENSQYLSLWQILIAGVALSIISAILFQIVDKLTKCPNVAQFMCIVVWICFFVYNDAFIKINSYFYIRHRYVLIILCLVLSVLFLGAWFLSKKVNLEKLALFVGVMMTFLIVTNSFLAVYRFVSLKDYEAIESKTSFTINDASLTPNVYWFHCDGMLSFDAVEKYFGDTQEDFAAALESRKFIINREAEFEAGHSTQVALPALMCPDFYDVKLGEQLENGERLNYGQLLKARQANELIRAFIEKGYHTSTIAAFGIYFFPVTDVFYNGDTPEAPRMGHFSQELSIYYSEFLSMIHFFPIFLRSAIGNTIFISNYGQPLTSQLDANSILKLGEALSPGYESMIRSLDEVLDMPEPRFTVSLFNIAHFPYIYDENGRVNPSANNNVLDYAPQHRFTSKQLIYVVDMILERDPDAVIILQADHGIHGHSADQIMEGLSISEEAVRDVRNGVMSAVRIPEKYNPPEEPLHPLDITRYLVNNYVGENYPYLFYRN